MSAKIAAVSAVLLVFGGCFTPQEKVPETGRSRPQLRYTEAQMAELGKEAYAEVTKEYTVVETGSDAEMVRRVGERLAKTTGKSAADSYDWEFKLLDEDKTVNAFCLPGGKVAVFSGILPICDGEEGLAVVLSHEIAHATLQHGNERMSQSAMKGLIGIPVGTVTNLWGAIAPGSRKAVMDGLGLGALFGAALPWDQRQESEADEVGLRYMQKAGYDIDEAPRFWQRMEAASPPGQVSDSLSTHPASEKRAEDLKHAIEKMKADQKKESEGETEPKG